MSERIGPGAGIARGTSAGSRHDGPAGRVVVVTGATGAAGTATTRALQAAGATVVAVDHSAARLSALANAQPGVFTEVADLSEHAAAGPSLPGCGNDTGPSRGSSISSAGIAAVRASQAPPTRIGAFCPRRSSTRSDTSRSPSMNDTGPVIGRSRCHRLDGRSRLSIGRIRQLRGRKGRGGGMDARTGRLAAPHSIRAQGEPGAADLGDPVIVGGRAASSDSTTGIRPPARSACALSIPPRRTSTSSPPQSRWNSGPDDSWG